MIFLFPVPIIVGGGVAYFIGRQAFWQCSSIAKTWTTDKDAVPDSILPSVLGAMVFFGAYGSSLHQLRLLKSVATKHVNRAADRATGASSAEYKRIAGVSSKPVITFGDFMREALPVALVHSQALAVSVVFSGFVHGGTEGYMVESSDVGESKLPK